MSQIMYNRLIVRAARMFLHKGGNSSILLQEVVSEVFNGRVPRNAANDVLILCVQLALAERN